MQGNSIEDGIPDNSVVDGKLVEDPTFLTWFEEGLACNGGCGSALSGRTRIERALILLNPTPEAQEEFIAEQRGPMREQLTKGGTLCEECTTRLANVLFRANTASIFQRFPNAVPVAFDKLEPQMHEDWMQTARAADEFLRRLSRASQ